MNSFEPWKTPTYNAQCITARIASLIAESNPHANVTLITAALKPPYCLRVVPAYRTDEMQIFRNKVARIAKWARNNTDTRGKPAEHYVQAWRANNTAR